MTTLGTGIGSALFLDGALVPNTELGHLEMRGKEAEKRASEIVRERDGLTWEKWAKRLDEYFQTLEALFSPGPDHRRRRRQQEGRQVPAAAAHPDRDRAAQLQNEAGIVGAAIAAAAANA